MTWASWRIHYDIFQYKTLKYILLPNTFIIIELFKNKMQIILMINYLFFSVNHVSGHRFVLSILKLTLSTDNYFCDTACQTTENVTWNNKLLTLLVELWSKYITQFNLMPDLLLTLHFYQMCHIIATAFRYYSSASQREICETSLIDI